MRIGLDLDDTLCNTRDLQKIYWKEYVSKNYSDKYTEELPKEINQFGIDYIDTFWNEYRRYLFSPAIKENAKAVINELRARGVEFILITSRPKEVYDDLDGMISSWFFQEGIALDRICTGIRNKGEFVYQNNIDILIDDDLGHVESARRFGKQAIQFTEDMTWLQLREILNRYLG